jgi:hypothetical protein
MCCLTATKLSNNSAIGGEGMRNIASGMVSISSLAAAMAGAYRPRNIAPYATK